MQKATEYFRSFQRTPDERHIDTLDGIRVLIILIVGWFHIWQQSWFSPSFFIGKTYISLDFLLRSGYMWVDGMLLLSGFLLYLPYTRSGSKLPEAVPFYKRRLVRILPSYLLCVAFFFAAACFEGRYTTVLDAIKDLAAHLTFTHTFFYFSYLGSPINGVLWTLAVEVQFYLLFPLVARCFQKKPLITYIVMAAAAFGYRYYVGATKTDTSMWFNQLPAFLDVYANGFVAASAFAALRKQLGERVDGKVKVFFTAVVAVCVCLLMQIARAQAGSSGYDMIRQGQMDRRFSFTAVLGCLMVCSAFSCTALRFLLGNRVMRYLAAISFQFYMYHQWIAVTLKEMKFIPSASETPWSSWDQVWQVSFTVLSFVLAIILATLITYLFERPVARALRRKLGVQQKN
ncbi:MAG: acyltransferase [Clostridia bacterium]|nr:acyltransferase [Clostridia bacterium]